MKIDPIPNPLPGERVVDVVPTIRPNVEPFWHRRLNLFTGRSLSGNALTAEQAGRAGSLATRGQMVSPGVVKGLQAGIEQEDTIWVEDTLPEQAQPFPSDGEPWNWVQFNPIPFSGRLAHQSVGEAVRQHGFIGAANPLTINATDVLIAYIYLDSGFTPSEIMLQWHDLQANSWEHRAYWGEDRIDLGTNETQSRRRIGELPVSGTWVRLEVPVSEMGLEGKIVDGIIFTIYNGRATWDRVGKARSLCGIAAGFGITAQGEDVVVLQELRVALTDLPIYAPSAILDGGIPENSEVPSPLLARKLGPSLGELIENKVMEKLPKVGILVLQPIVVKIIGKPTEVCDEDDLENSAFADEELIDGCRLVLYTWPSEWLFLPERGERWRNRLAYAIFSAEKGNGLDQVMPWEEVGVPIALIAFENNWQPAFIDNYAVVRMGGKPKSRTPLVANAGSSFLWQARVQQFAEQLAEIDVENTPIAQIAQLFRYLPPVGILPKSAIDARKGEDNFFPSPYAVQATPIPLEQLDLVMQASASLTPFDTFTPDQVQVLIPVAQNLYDPYLLKLEKIDPQFIEAIRLLVAKRGEWLYRRELVRRRGAIIFEAIDGSAPVYPQPDRNALPDELKRPVPFTSTRVLQSQPRTGGNLYWFKDATEKLKINVGDILTVYVYIDANNKGDRLEIWWNLDNSLLRIGFWTVSVRDQVLNNDGEGEGLTSRYLGNISQFDRWVRLEVPASKLGLEGGTLYGMAISTSGQVAWGHAGKTVAGAYPDQDIVWLGDRLPTGAEIIRSDGWTWVEVDKVGKPSTITDLVEEDNAVAKARRFKPFVSQRALVSDVGKGGKVYSFQGASPLLNVTPIDTLTTYVYLDPNNLPSQIELWWFTDNDEKRLGRAYWGQVNSAMFGTTIYKGVLPEAGKWVNLLVGVPELGWERGTLLSGMAFVVYNGRAAFAHAGVRRGLNRNVDVWVSNQLPAGAAPQTSGNWNWVDLDERFTPFGDRLSPLIIEEDYETEATVVIPIKQLKEELAKGPLAVEVDQLTKLGLVRFIEYLQQKVQIANDKINISFARAQIDIYRVRQLTLDTDTASRLVTSPALAEIAKRGESARATQEQLKTYYDRATKNPIPQKSPQSGLLADTTFEDEEISASTVESASLLFETATAISQEFVTPSQISATQLFRVRENALEDVIEQSPIVGQALRTTTVAERLKDPSAVEAKNFTVAGRYEVVNNLADLGINLDQNIPIPGLIENDANGQTRNITFGELKDSARKATILQNILGGRYDPVNGTSESDYFSAGIKAIDNSVATLRIAEGGVQLYRLAIVSCQKTLSKLQQLVARVNQRLQVIEDELAEARHDLSVARLLLDEENLRIKNINERRDRIIQDYVSFLVFHRPRFSDTLVPTPYRALDPGVTVSPVPACLNRQIAVPSELRAMIMLFREAPVQWFTQIPRILDRLDRLEMLYKTVQGAIARTSLQIAAQQEIEAIASNVNFLGQSINRLYTAQRQIVMQRQSQITAIDYNTIIGQNWRQSRNQAETILSLGDLIDGNHGRSDISQQAARALEDIAHVAACLYANFGEVLPAIRLDWAQRLSQFDEPVNLQNLASLPRWGEISYLERRETQTLVDWLYQQIDQRQPQALSLVSDLVRICILLASHAPVNQIISGRTIRQTTVNLGVRVDLAVDPATVRIGMQVLLYSSFNKVVAQAVVDDLSAGQAAAQIVNALEPNLQLPENTRVQFTEQSIFTRNIQQ